MCSTRSAPYPFRRTRHGWKLDPVSPFCLSGAPARQLLPPALPSSPPANRISSVEPPNKTLQPKPVELRGISRVLPELAVVRGAPVANTATTRPTSQSQKNDRVALHFRFIFGMPRDAQIHSDFNFLFAAPQNL